MSSHPPTKYAQYMSRDGIFNDKKCTIVEFRKNMLFSEFSAYFYI